MKGRKRRQEVRSRAMREEALYGQRGPGRGWHGESRRHAEAASKGRATQKHPGPKMMQRQQAETTLNSIRKLHIESDTFFVITGELRASANRFPDDSDEYIVLRELEWIFVQLHDDPPRLLKEKWGFKPEKER